MYLTPVEEDIAWFCRLTRPEASGEPEHPASAK